MLKGVQVCRVQLMDQKTFCKSIKPINNPKGTPISIPKTKPKKLSKNPKYVHMEQVF